MEIDEVKLERFHTFDPKLVRVETRDGERPLIRGLGVVFGQRSEDFGGFFEVIHPNALDETDMSDVRALFNHDPNKLLGRTTSGTMRLKRTDRGLEYEIDPPDTPTGNEVRAMIERGDLTGSSFSFTLPARGGWAIEELEDGTLIRSILKIERLYDVGPVTFPAYPQTEAFARGLEPARSEIERYRQSREELARLEGRKAAIKHGDSLLALAKARGRLAGLI
jgi:HK97 family phage prohead protease